MRQPPWLIVVAAFGVALLVNARDAIACDCHDGGPVCEAYWKAPVIFAGRVVAITPNETREALRVQFAVGEAFKGTSAKLIELTVGGTSCDLAFSVGEEWLIYAVHFPGSTALSTGTCSRSRPLASAASDVAYARTVPTTNRSRGRIVGRLVYLDQLRINAVAGVQVAAEEIASGRTVTTTTDARGQFEIEAAPGAHRMSATLRRGMKLIGDDTVTLADARGCAEWQAWTEYHGSIAGVLRDSTGAPVRGVAIQIVAAEGNAPPRDEQRALTDAGGRFEIRGFSPGEYFVAIADGSRRSRDDARAHFIYAGGETATRFRIEGGERTSMGNFTLPATAHVIEVAGVVQHADGQPAAGAKVAIKADEDDWSFFWTTMTTNRLGQFRFAVVKGARYRIMAADSPTRPGPRVIVDTAVPVDRVRLVIP
jgi:5-hydroxyisourate hydrolase-like protein (transthyretin family)